MVTLRLFCYNNKKAKTPPQTIDKSSGVDKFIIRIKFDSILRPVSEIHQDFFKSLYIKDISIS